MNRAETFTVVYEHETLWLKHDCGETVCAVEAGDTLDVLIAVCCGAHTCEQPAMQVEYLHHDGSDGVLGETCTPSTQPGDDLVCVCGKRIVERYTTSVTTPPLGTGGKVYNVPPEAWTKGSVHGGV